MPISQEKFNDTVYSARQLYAAEMLNPENRDIQSEKYRAVYTNLLQLIENDELEFTTAELEKKIGHIIVSCRERRCFYQKGDDKKAFDNALNYRTEDFIVNFNSFFKTRFLYTKEADSESIISTISFFLQPSQPEAPKSKRNFLVFSTEIIDFNTIDPVISVSKVAEHLHENYFVTRIEIPNDSTVIDGIHDKLNTHPDVVQIGMQHTKAGELKLRKNGVISMLFAKTEIEPGFVQAPVPDNLPLRFRN